MNSLQEFETATYREWIELSGIDLDLYRLNVECVADEIQGSGGEVSRPIEDALNWQSSSRWSLKGKQRNYGAIISSYNGSVFQVKLSKPRLNKEGKTLKYETPLGTATKPFYATITFNTWLKIANRQNVHADTVSTFLYKYYSKSEYQDVTTEKVTTEFSPAQISAAFWKWVQVENIPIKWCEGAKKACCLLSHGYVAIALSGVSNGYRTPKDLLGNKIGKSYLVEDVANFVNGDRTNDICFDSDNKAKTIQGVNANIKAFGALINAKAKEVSKSKHDIDLVRVLSWEPELGKGVDDLIVTNGIETFEAIANTAKSYTVWLFEQNLETAKQRLEISDRLSHDVEITHDEFKALTPESLKALTGNARDIALNAFTAAGKTEKAKDIIRDYPYAIAPFHRKALAQSASKELGLTYRTDRDRNLTKLGYCNEAGSEIEGAINGLLDKEAFAFGDEFDQQLESLALSSTHGKDGRRKWHTNIFWRNFTRAVQTLITSADLTDYEINQFHKITGRKPFVVKVKTVKKAYEAFMYQQFADFWQKFNNAIAQGKRILVLCTRKEDAKFLAFAYGAVPVHADNSNDYRELLDTPNIWLPNNKPILMAVSPVFGTGFSITHDAFDCVFGWFKADNIPAKGLIQFLNRYRLPVERHIYCDYSSGRFDGLTSDDLFKTRLSKAKAQNVNEGEASFINHDDPYFHYKAETNWSLAHLRADLFARLEHDVETVEYVRSQLSEQERKAVTKELNAKLKEYRDTYPITVYEARNLSLSEYLTLKDRQDLSESDRLAVAKFEIADWSCLTPDQLTLERVQRDRKGKKRKAVGNLEMQSFPQIAKALDKASVEKQTKHGEGIAHQDISHHALRVEALDKLGIGEALDYVLSGAVWSNDTAEIVAIAQKLIDNRDALTKLGISLTCGKNASHNAMFGALLKNYLGLQTVRTQKRIEGKVTSFYQLCGDDLALTKTDLIARLQRNIKKYGALIPNSQKSFVERLYGCHIPFDNTNIQKVCDSYDVDIETIPDTPPIDEPIAIFPIAQPTQELENIPTAIATIPIPQPTFITQIIESTGKSLNFVADTVITAIADYLSPEEIAAGFF